MKIDFDIDKKIQLEELILVNHISLDILQNKRYFQDLGVIGGWDGWRRWLTCSVLVLSCSISDELFNEIECSDKWKFKKTQTIP